MSPRRLVGIIGSGQIGLDPFDRKSWSGSSYSVFNELRGRGLLYRAFGAEVRPLRRHWLMLRHWHPDGIVWRRNYYMSRGYLEALTAEVGRHLEPGDLDHDFLQLGAMFDVPRLVVGRALCFSYHDGNLAQALKAPNAPRGLSGRRIEEGLAFERAFYHKVDRIFTMSEYLRRSFIEDFDVPAGRIVTIGGGINLDSVPEPVPDKRYDTQELLFIGIDFARKGGHELLEAFRRVRETHPAARLHIVGPRALRIDPELADGVQYHGFLRKGDPADARRLSDLLDRCVLFVMPSLYEPFGIAPLEAMVHQIPALVSDGWALAENVRPGVTGELVRPGAIDELVDRLRELLSDPEKLSRMGEAGRAEVLARHTWPRVIDRLVAGIEAARASHR